MKNPNDRPNPKKFLSRRSFIGAGGAAVVGSTLAFRPTEEEDPEKSREELPKVREYRTLGRTGFEVSDICMGGTRNNDPAVFRYAYDCGINFFDTAERYVNGTSERLIGEALEEMDRKKIFINTKLHIEAKETEESILARFQKCQERLRVDYIDGLYMHGVSDPEEVKHAAFHSATTRLKKEGRLKFIGVSSHGSRQGSKTAMEDTLCAAAEDGRFDLMLLIYNFMNQEAGEKVLAACKKNNMGTMAMKTAPGVLKFVPVDPDNLTDEQEQMIERLKGFGMSGEKALQRLVDGQERQKESVEKTRPFVEKHGIKTEDQLLKASIQWVLKNPDMNSVCVSFGNFELVDKIIPISGKKLSQADTRFLDDYHRLFNDQYCRHGCDQCAKVCDQSLPVSTIMRLAYYFAGQGREKFAMGEYAKLAGNQALNCAVCSAPCSKACPYSVDVRAQLLQAHSLLTLV